MSETTFDPPGLSRRNLLKVGLFGSALLASAGIAASLTGCSASTPGAGYAVLRESDLPMLRALIPALLEEAVTDERMSQAVDGTLSSLDHALYRLSPQVLKQTLQLFDLLALPMTRGPLTGIWGVWENASTDHVRAFLSRWEHSVVGLLKMGHAALLQLLMMAWYGRPESWEHCGYPGPPAF